MMMKSRNNRHLKKEKKNLKKRTLTMVSKLSTSFRLSNCFLPTTPQRLTPLSSLSMTRSLFTAIQPKRRKMPSDKNLFKNGRKNKKPEKPESKEIIERKNKG
jgi:hypothetical protein